MDFTEEELIELRDKAEAQYVWLKTFHVIHADEKQFADERVEFQARAEVWKSISLKVKAFMEGK